MTFRNPTAVPRTYDEVRALLPRAARAAPGKRRPNVVIWIMDDVGFGHLSPYGGLVEMPAMQKIADRGMLFSNFHVTPLCAPTRSCLLTGRNHHTNHMGSLPLFAAEDNHWLRPDINPLPLLGRGHLVDRRLDPGLRAAQLVDRARRQLVVAEGAVLQPAAPARAACPDRRQPSAPSRVR